KPWRGCCTRLIARPVQLCGTSGAVPGGESQECQRPGRSHPAVAINQWKELRVATFPSNVDDNRDSGAAPRQSALTANLAAYYQMLTTPRPDGVLTPPPIRKLRPATIRGGVRMRLRDRLAEHMRLLAQRPEGKGVGDAS